MLHLDMKQYFLCLTLLLCVGLLQTISLETAQAQNAVTPSKRMLVAAANRPRRCPLPRATTTCNLGKTNNMAAAKQFNYHSSRATFQPPARNSYRSQPNQKPLQSMPITGNTWFSGTAKSRVDARKGLTAKGLLQQAVRNSNTHKFTKPKKKAKRTSDKSADILVLHYDKSVSSWRSDPQHTATGETIALQGEHHVGAYTRLDNSDSFDLSAGPEIIIKERKQNETLNKIDQPDSQLGVGMHFQYKF